MLELISCSIPEIFSTSLKSDKKMIPSLKEIEFQAKQERTTIDQTKFSKATTSSSTSTRQWVGSRNPRIFRVSRAFGGKDRHSKVCTIRGLRDRRIRLSVPTAIQLYDLQDRLGVGQPSKVIDWLLDVTKLDIDKLPPLQMPQGNFSQFFPCDHQSNNAQFFDVNNQSFLKDMEDQAMMGGSSSKEKHSWDFGDLRSKNKDVNEEQDDDDDHSMHGIENFNNNAQISAQNFFPMANQSSIPGFNLNPNYYQWDPSNLSLSQFGGSHGFSSQSDHHQDPHHNSSVAHVGPQLLFCPPTATAPSLFPTYSPYFGTNHLESDPRSQMINHFQCFPLNGSGTQPEKDKNGSL